MPTLKALLVNDASLLGHHGSALVSRQACRLAAEAGIRIHRGLDWTAAERMLAGPNEYDLVIVNGEGSVHHDSATARRIARMACDLSDRGVPAFMINASVEANSDEVHSGLARFRKIYVRDVRSQKTLAAAGIPSTVVHDLTLTWSDAPKAEPSPSREVLVTDASDTEKALLLYRFSERTGCRAMTLRTAPPAGLRRWRRRAGFELKRLAGALLPGSPWTLRYAGATRNFDEFARQLATSPGIICGRFHAVCLAIRMGIPFLAVAAPTSKIEDLLSEIGMSHRMVDIESLCESACVPEIPPIDGRERQSINTFLLETKGKARQMFDDIAADVLMASLRSGDGSRETS
ncbi:MAG: polysaccharide pyruvyl transferase family protein [Deltaproteobacteria bacterium]